MLQCGYNIKIEREWYLWSHSLCYALLASSVILEKLANFTSLLFFFFFLNLQTWRNSIFWGLAQQFVKFRKQALKAWKSTINKYFLLKIPLLWEHKLIVVSSEKIKNVNICTDFYHSCFYYVILYNAKIWWLYIIRYLMYIELYVSSMQMYFILNSITLNMCTVTFYFTFFCFFGTGLFHFLTCEHYPQLSSSAH